nr:hypothetical protein L204_05320 [Cryptococcus depauperatus CBS 7855]
MSNSNEYWNPEDPRYYQFDNPVNQTFDGTNFWANQAGGSQYPSTASNLGLAPPPWTASHRAGASIASTDGWATSDAGDVDLDEIKRAKIEKRRLAPPAASHPGANSSGPNAAPSTDETEGSHAQGQ